jgi:putative ATPase
MKNFSAEAAASLFSEEDKTHHRPLSARVRPRNLGEYAGQRHILGPGQLLTRAIEADRLSSLILYGPPGVGKTSLAYCISLQTRAHFEKLNAVCSNVEDIRKILAASRNRIANGGRRTILFIDEIHRFNKAQQDVLMPDLEEGQVVLVGATVYNPYFSLIGPLISRSLIFELKPLAEDEIIQVLDRALGDRERGLGKGEIDCAFEAKRFIARACDGDARKALNALEIACLTTPPDPEGRRKVGIKDAEASMQKKNIVYDDQGDAHYDTASAFIKSMRGSDPDATLYWLAKMIYAGEDPRFIARRICICAAEDVGNADPRALMLANAAREVAEFIGLPEARIPLAQAAVYIAGAPKSNAAYLGIEKAIGYVRDHPTQPVPRHLQDASCPGAEKLGRGQGYQYSHDFPQHYVNQEYMPDKQVFYEPAGLGYEKQIREWLKSLPKNGK